MNCEKKKNRLMKQAHIDAGLVVMATDLWKQAQSWAEILIILI